MATSSELVTKPPTKDITKQYPYMRIDLTGRQFGHLTVLYRDGVIYGRKPAWMCQCDCPDRTLRRIASRDLRSGKTTSCGCVLKAWQHRIGDLNRTHGMSKTSEHGIWKSMRQRCYRKSNPGYKNYGGRGIKVCERWNSFDNFIADMGKRPGPRYSIERVNNDGNYEPSNCIWIPLRDQVKNQRKKKNYRPRGINIEQIIEARETPYRWGLDNYLAKKFGCSRVTVRRWRLRPDITWLLQGPQP